MTVYDRRASGFIPGEGCGFVVLKRYEDAKQDGNPVYAVIKGWGISSDGSNAAITAPSVPGQSIALKRAYENAPYGIEELDFIEGHGTGTSVGDRVELDAIASVQNESCSEELDHNRSCGITSLKSLIGHTKAASGVGGFIKAVISVNPRICPPTANCHIQIKPSRILQSVCFRCRWVDALLPQKLCAPGYPPWDLAVSTAMLRWNHPINPVPNSNIKSMNAR